MEDYGGDVKMRQEEGEVMQDEREEVKKRGVKVKEEIL